MNTLPHPVSSQSVLAHGDHLTIVEQGQQPASHTSPQTGDVPRTITTAVTSDSARRLGTSTRLRLLNAPRSHLRRLADDLSRLRKAVHPGIDVTQKMHAILEGVLDEAMKERLSPAERQGLSDLNDYITHGKQLERLVDDVLRALGELEEAFPSNVNLRSAWTQTRQRTGKVIGRIPPRVVLLLGIVATMGLKNAAWQSGAILSRQTPSLSVNDIRPNEHMKMLGLIARRWITANSLAVAEYGVGVVTQKKWNAHGLPMNTYLGVSQAIDMAFALITLKLGGEDVHPNEIIALIGQALAVAVFVGALNAIWDAIKKTGLRESLFGVQREANEAYDMPERVAAPLSEDISRNEHVEANSSMPTGKAARRQGAAIAKALKTVTPQIIEQHKENLRQSVVPHLNSVSARLAARGEQVPTAPTPEAARSSISQESTLATLVQNNPANSSSLEGLESLLDELEHNLNAFQDSFNNLSSDAAPHNLTVLLTQLTEIREQLKKNGGKDLRQEMLYLFIGLGYASTFAGAILAATSDMVALRNLNARGAVHATGSVFGQVLAQCLHLVIPDNVLDTSLKKNLKSLGISLAGTVLEFTQQQAGFALMDQGRLLAGQYTETPAKAWPTKSEIRSTMETTRTTLTTVFNRVMLGEAIEPRHIAGLLISSAFSGVALGWGNKIAEEMGHPTE